ncbi:MAG: hypothetical protein O2999_11310 [Nitrospirae bacterium]|nr:hypothetical protein [Nitrospirota bacterium]MDA1304867.1 hypothetical protein [Nitrospirota bacterium]
MMKNMARSIACIIGLLAGLRLLVEELSRAGLIEDRGSIAGWLETLHRLALAPLPISNIGILVCSLSILGILLVLGRTKRETSKKIPLPHTPPRETIHDKPQPAPLSSTEGLITKAHVEEEWHRLEEADKETIREIVVQEGLWESDIVALLQTRGLWSHHARYDSLAERVSFVQCDFAGYHSILPDYRSLLEDVLAADYAEDLQ